MLMLLVIHLIIFLFSGFTSMFGAMLMFMLLLVMLSEEPAVDEAGGPGREGVGVDDDVSGLGVMDVECGMHVVDD